MDLEKLMEKRNTGFIKELGIKQEIVEPGHAIASLEIRPEFANPIGSTHGGVIFSLADTVGGAAASSRGRWPTTLSSTINYLSPAMNCKELIGESREIKTGKTTGVYGVTIKNEFGKKIADVTITYYYLAEISDASADASADIAKAKAERR